MTMACSGGNYPPFFLDNSNIALHRERTDQLSHNALINGGVSIFASLVGEMWHPWVVFYTFLLQVVERLEAGLCVPTGTV